MAAAKALNEKGIAGPSGRAWRDTTIRGHALRGTGILRNELYIGRLVWNRLTFIRNPATGRRVSRMNAGGTTQALAGAQSFRCQRETGEDIDTIAYDQLLR